MAAVLVEQRDEFIPALAQLLGMETGNPRGFRRGLTDSVRESRPGSLASSLSYDDIRNVVYGELSRPTPPEPPAQDASLTSSAPSLCPTREKGFRKVLRD
ncbi:MAG TPA: hypothetical protein VEU33_37915, partial [Archangium sp.]|nr:hypothetical protein [Archangium sp.]